MSEDGSQKCVQSVEFLVLAYSEWRSMCSSQRSAEAEKARTAAPVAAAPFFLASAPVSELGRAKDLVLARGGQYAAGDKDDIFNSMTLHDQESWKVGWKGKVEMCINVLKTQNPGKEITCLAIAGGPACDWERAELRNTFCSNHPQVCRHAPASPRLLWRDHRRRQPPVPRGPPGFLRAERAGRLVWLEVDARLLLGEVSSLHALLPHLVLGALERLLLVR